MSYSTVKGFFHKKDICFHKKNIYFVVVLIISFLVATYLSFPAIAKTTLKATSTPLSPSNVKATLVNNAVYLTWDQNRESDLLGYYIYGKEKGSLGFVRLNGAPVKDESYTDVLVSKGRTYVYYVTAVNKANEESLPSDEVEITVKETFVFKDVSQDSWYKQSLDKLIASGVIDGFSDGTFKPTKKVTRAEFSKMLVVAMGWTSIIPQQENEYSDLKRVHWAYRYLMICREKGALTGYSDNTFRPNKEITREEIAKILIVAKNIIVWQSTQNPFNDISKSWAKNYITSCAELGLMQGYPDKTFRPKSTLSRAEAVVLLERILK